MNALTRAKEIEPSWLKLVAAQVESLRFGTVQIAVHENHVAQIERLKSCVSTSESRGRVSGFCVGSARE